MMVESKADLHSVDSSQHHHDGNKRFTDPGITSNVIPSLVAMAEPLCTVKTMSIVFIFEIFMSSAYYVALSIGLLKYLSWGLSIIQVVQATLIFTSVETFAQVFAATLSDKTKSVMLGRRKPFILVGTALQFVSVFFLCMPPSSLTSKELYAWYISFSSVS
jgi:Na+/melibiose symporter-like transporter